MDDERKTSCALHELRLNQLTDGVKNLDDKMDIKFATLDDKIDTKFELLTNIILQDRQMKQSVQLQKSSNKVSFVTVALGGLLGFVSSLVMALLHII